MPSCYFNAYYNYHDDNKWVVFIDDINDFVCKGLVKKTLYKNHSNKIIKKGRCKEGQCGVFDAILLTDLIEIVDGITNKKETERRKRILKKNSFIK